MASNEVGAGVFSNNQRSRYGGLEGGSDLAIVAGADDVTVKFVRLVKWPSAEESVFDPGGIDDGDSRKGCGCSVVGYGPAAGLAFVVLLGLMGLALRRRG